MARYDETIIFRPVTKRPKLFIFYDGRAEEHRLNSDLTIGRGSADRTPDLVIARKTVSRIHGEFYRNDGQYYYRNISTSNGTLIDGHDMQPGEICRLEDGDRLIIHPRYDHNGNCDVLIVFSTSYLDDTAWKKINLNENYRAITIGRAESLQIDDCHISRHHACFLQSEGRWAIMDLGSRNGVLLNRHRLTDAEYLYSGDVVTIAGYLFVFLGNDLFYQAVSGKSTASGTHSDDNAVLSIDIAERNVWSRWKKKTLLKDIKLDIHAGEFVLILGGSGAGKTTFINAVMGYEKAKGHITYRNVDLYDQYRKMKYEIGYVPQQTTMRPSDIVIDTLMDAAEMRMPTGISYAERKRKVQEVINNLGLQEQAHEQIGKISGGQKKRVSLAIEYLGNPSLFFLDEPDSGIDETESMEIMQNLRMIADEKKIVMLISHSPDRVAKLLDKVIVLTKSRQDGSGHLAFFGSPKQALDFFDVPVLSGIIKKINPVSEGGEGRADEFIQKYREMMS